MVLTAKVCLCRQNRRYWHVQKLLLRFALKVIFASVDCILIMCEEVLLLQYNSKLRARMSTIPGYAHRSNAVHSAASRAQHTVLDWNWSSLKVNILTECFEYRGALVNPERSTYHVAPNYLIDDTRASRHDQRDSMPCSDELIDDTRASRHHQRDSMPCSDEISDSIRFLRDPCEPTRCLASAEDYHRKPSSH